MMRFESCAITNTGRRSNNEDAHLNQPTLGVFGVADGMGGYEGGEVASRLAVQTLEALYQRFRADPEATFPWRPVSKMSLEENRLSAAIHIAHQAITKRRVGPLSDMGSTLAALTLPPDGQVAILAHVGDSRIYRLRGVRFEQLTRDHSLYEEMRAASGTTEMGSKRECPYANIITRALGLHAQAEPDVSTVPVQPGDLFLICSDGLSDALPEPAMQKILATAKDKGGALESATKRLIQAAYNAGSKDNITAVTVLMPAA